MNYNYEYKINKESYFLNNLRGFKVKFMGATNYLGSRVKILDTRHNKSVVLSYDYSIGDIVKQSIKYLDDQGISINGMTHNEKTKEYTLLSLDFSTSLKGA
tara:strand:+ start:186 stop:488 length:303 start_codon:yes stop_codon:yes gene_type:complete